MIPFSYLACHLPNKINDKRVTQLVTYIVNFSLIIFCVSLNYPTFFWPFSSYCLYLQLSKKKCRNDASFPDFPLYFPKSIEYFCFVEINRLYKDNLYKLRLVFGFIWLFNIPTHRLFSCSI